MIGLTIAALAQASTPVQAPEKAAPPPIVAYRKSDEQMAAEAATTRNAESETVFHLICEGGGTGSRTNSATTYLSDNHGNSVSGTSYYRSSVPYADQVEIDIRPGISRIRIPRTIVPPLNSGSGGGWHSINRPFVGRDEISGDVALNFLNKPRFTVSRVTGRVVLNGSAGTFSGQCQRVREDQPRAF